MLVPTDHPIVSVTNRETTSFGGSPFLDKPISNTGRCSFIDHCPISQTLFVCWVEMWVVCCWSHFTTWPIFAMIASYEGTFKSLEVSPYCEPSISLVTTIHHRYPASTSMNYPLVKLTWKWKLNIPCFYGSNSLWMADFPPNHVSLPKCIYWPTVVALIPVVAMAAQPDPMVWVGEDSLTITSLTKSCLWTRIMIMGIIMVMVMIMVMII